MIDLTEVIVILRHARTFITSRQKMHPTGVYLYDELLTKLEAENQPAAPLVRRAVGGQNE